MSDTPISVLFGSDGYELSIKPDLTIPDTTKGLLALGNNAGTAKFISVDSSGKLVVIGGGVAGAPNAGVFTIQGIDNATPVAISGEISISNFPTTQTISGSIDVSNFPVTQTVAGTVTANIGTTNGLALNASLTDGYQRSKITDGTNNAALSNANPLGTEQGLVVRNIPSGTQTVSGTINVGNFPATQPVSGTIAISNFPATQPISGTVTSNIGTTNGLALDANLTNGTQRSRITDGTNNAVLANATPGSTDYGLVVRNIPSGTQPVSGTVAVSNFPGTQPVSGAVTANIGTTNGLALDNTLTGGSQRSKITDGTNNAAVKAASTAAVATDPALVVAISPNNSLTISGTVTSNIGTTNGLALDATLTGGTQRSRITDGTNNAVVKPASTAALATDPALVVAISPNSPITASISGSNFGVTSLPGNKTSSTTLNGISQSFTIYSGDGYNTTSFELTGTWAGTYTVQGSVNNSTWSQINFFDILNDSYISSTSTNGIYRLNNAGYKYLRIICTGWSSGSTLIYVNNDIGIIHENSVGQKTSSQSIPVVLANDHTPITTSVVSYPLYSPVTNTINSLGGTSQINIQGGVNTLYIQLTGSWSGVVVFEGSVDGVYYYPVRALNISNQLIVTEYYTNGAFQINCASFQYVRVRAKIWNSGSLDVCMFLSIAKPDVDTGGNLYYLNSSLSVNTEPSAVFCDYFDGATLDTVKWSPPTTQNSGSYTISNSELTLTTGVASAAYTTISSIPTFMPMALSPQAFNIYLKMEMFPNTGTHRFFGVGTLPTTVQATYSSSTVGPLYNAVGFEQDTTGALNAVIVANGVKVYSYNIARPNDGLYHNYMVWYCAGRYVFYIDNFKNPVATTNFVMPNSQNLPIHIHLINDSGINAPSSSPTFKLNNISWSDFGHNSHQISDGTNPWKKAVVDSNGSLQILPGPRNKKKYMCSTLAITPTVTAGATTRCCSLFRSSASTKTVEITRILVNCSAGTGAQTYGVIGDFITAENGTPNGTVRTVQALNRSDGASIVTFRNALTGAPTAVGADALRLHVQSSQALSVELFKIDDVGAPIVLRPSTNEGFEIRVVVDGSNLTTAPKISIVIYWDEY